jgi:hypothetical protein
VREFTGRLRTPIKSIALSLLASVFLSFVSSSTGLWLRFSPLAAQNMGRSAIDEFSSRHMSPNPEDENFTIPTVATEEHPSSISPFSDEPDQPEIAASATYIPAINEVDQYLWDVYQRSNKKLDSHGDLSWKDGAAGDRISLSIQEYVIGGMDSDFRELLFHAGRALDAAGIDWTILSAFRDDYRQSIAVGFKAHDSNSFHGGSAATGGYGHGCAVDVASKARDSTSEPVWNWLDHHGKEFGLHRPMPRIDPAHVQPYGEWRYKAAMLRKERTGMALTGLIRGSTPSEPKDEQPEPELPEEQVTCAHSSLTHVTRHVFGRSHLARHMSPVTVRKNHAHLFSAKRPNLRVSLRRAPPSRSGFSRRA